MAYVSKEDKARIQPLVKSVLQKYNLKGSLRVRNYSTLILTLRSGAIDFEKYIDGSGSINVFYIDKHFDGPAAKALSELRDALKGPDYFDKSDIMTDYFDCSHYYDIHIGTYEKPYKFIK